MKSFKKIGAAVLAFAMVQTMCLSSVLGVDAATKKDKSSSAGKKIEKEYPALLNSTKTEGKEETIYASLSADGVQKEAVGEEWLKNPNKQKNIKDYSTLSNIENTEGSEKYTKDGNNLTWKADKNDIRYRGNVKDQLPVEVNVSYYLNGEKVSAKQIKGKSGDVEIRFSYNVNTVDQVNGYSIVHPYIMASAVVLNNEHFTDVHVKTGQVISDGNEGIYMGMAMPGLKQNLGPAAANLDIPDTVSITAHTDKFSLAGTYTVATTEPFDGLNLSGSTDTVKGKINELTSGLNQLSSASDKLVAGSNRLASGASTLSAGANQLAAGNAQLNSRVQGVNLPNVALSSAQQKQIRNAAASNSAVQAGANQLSSGIASQVPKGISESIKNSDLTEAQQKSLNTKVTESVTKALTDPNNQKAINDAVTAALSNEETQNAISSQVTSALQNDKTVTAAVNSAVSADTYKTKLAADLKDTVSKYVVLLMQAGITDQSTAVNLATNLATEAAGIGTSDAADAAGKAAAGAAGKVAGNAAAGAAAKVAGNTAASTAANVAGNAAATEAGNAVKGYIADSVGSDATAASVQSQLSGSVTSAFQQVAGQAAVGGAQGVITQVSQTVNSFKGQLAQLKAGTRQLASGSAQVANGAGQLSSGAATLAAGMNTFDQTGIKKLVGTLNNADLAGMTSRLEAISQATKNHPFIGGKLENTPGVSRIIFKTAEI